MDITDTLIQIQARLLRIEQQLSLNQNLSTSPSKPTNPFENHQSSKVEPTFSIPVMAQAKIGREPPSTRKSNVNGTAQLLGFGGAAAVIIAAIYMISLSIDRGWLTPLRQVIGVAALGIGLIISGVISRDSEPDYIAALPGTGIVMIYLSIFGGHSYYHILSNGVAVVGLFATTLLSLFLGNLFKTEMLAFIAVFGTYLGPLFLRESFPGVAGLAIYFSFWAILFCSYSIVIKRRSIYLCALYLGLITFHSLSHDSTRWIPILLFQFGQLLMFGLGMLNFSIKARSPMGESDVISHLPAILIFYFLQFSVLDQNAHHLILSVPVISAAIVLGIFFIAERTFKKGSLVGGVLASTYVSLVLLHAVYVEFLTTTSRLAFGLIAFPLLGAITLKAGSDVFKKYWPLIVALGLICIVSAFDCLMVPRTTNSSGWATLIFAVEFYIGYFTLRKQITNSAIMSLFLYIAHFFAMAGVAKLLHEPMLVSFIWGAMAIFWLMLAKIKNSQVIGQSALFIYLLSGLKVIFWDLSHQDPLIKIVTLLFVGATFFVGGWIYQRIVSESTKKGTKT